MLTTKKLFVRIYAPHIHAILMRAIFPKLTAQVIINFLSSFVFVVGLQAHLTIIILRDRTLLGGRVELVYYR